MSGKILREFLCIIFFSLAVLWSLWMELPVVAAESAEVEESDKLTVVIDPGHGSYGSGASAEMDGETIHEEKLNLLIAEDLKKELESYEGVTVILTRESDEDVDLLERTLIAVEADADVLISIHNNAIGPNAEYDQGSTVLVARGQYKKDLADREQELGASILYELSRIGLQDNGLLVRDSTNGETYENGETADYYAIIRNGIKNDMMSVLIEHAFLDNSDDYHNFLSSDEKINELALADARGIARYFHLHKSDGSSPESLSDHEEKFLYMIDDNIEHNQHYTKIFFKDEKNQQSFEIDDSIFDFDYFKLRKKIRSDV